MKHDDIPQGMIDAIIGGMKLGEAAIKALEDVPHGEVITFECPICGGTAQACRAEYNGHLHVQCPGCGNSLMQ